MSTSLTTKTPDAEHLALNATRRAFDRTPVRAHALVHCDGRFQRVRVLDYSRGGLQLEGTFGLVERDAVEVELSSGVRLPAKVRWSLGRRTGVGFAELLTDEHPGMRELTRRAARTALAR